MTAVNYRNYGRLAASFGDVRLRLGRAGSANGRSCPGPVPSAVPDTAAGGYFLASGSGQQERSPCELPYPWVRLGPGGKEQGGQLSGQAGRGAERR